MTARVSGLTTELAFDSSGLTTSSATSSSISVVSVPFEVTGEGPTMSLGLSIEVAGFAGIRLAELGRRKSVPAAGGGDDLVAISISP